MYDIPTYYPHTAQKKYLLRRSYCHRGMFHSQEVLDYIEEKLRATWSPEQIACTPCELKLPSWRTIYRWIYEKYLVNGNLKVLRHKGKSHGVKETRGKYSKGKSIRKRDKSVYSREEAGHWEADTVVSGQGKSKACFATLAERKTRFYIAMKMSDRRAETMENAIVAALSAFPPQLVKTITLSLIHISTGRNQYVLDLCRAVVQDYIIANVHATLASAPIDYVKLEMNRHISDNYSPALAEMCIRDRHYTVPGDDFTRAGEASADLKARLKKLGLSLIHI